MVVTLGNATSIVIPGFNISVAFGLLEANFNTVKISHSLSLATVSMPQFFS